MPVQKSALSNLCAVSLLTASLCMAGCTRQDNSQIQHDTAQATEQAKQGTKQAAQETKQALKQAEDAVDSAAAGVKQGINAHTGPMADHSAGTDSGKTPAGKIDLNNASRDQLSDLPGITPPMADDIISHRPYATPREVVLSGALTPAQYHRIAAQVAVQ